ncbi:MAG: hypothetical protein LC797_15420 [Chloroflexi bacterium]|nr:hypothetical protein [Chloroflexota bacterium]
MRVGGVVQLQEGQGSVDPSGGAIFAWLVWLLSGIGAAVLIGFVLRDKFAIFHDSAQMVAQGRLGDAITYFGAVTVWRIGQAGQVAVQNWPLVLGGATLPAFLWVFRQL